jgi:hypothetical protein
MEDPRVYELLSLMLDEMKESRKEFREGFQSLREEFHDSLAVQSQSLIRVEALLQNQTNLFARHLTTTEAEQSNRISGLERRMEAVERKVA